MNVNLAAKPRGYPSLVTKACPVPAFNEDTGAPSGYWDWDEKTGVISASTAPGSANWNLFDGELVEVRWVPRMQICDPGQKGRNLEIEVDTKAKKVLPHWIFRITTKTTDANREVHLSWYLKLARKVMV